MFTEAWQKVIFLNYGKVKSENIAKVLGTDKEIVEKEAAAFGLNKISFNPDWKNKGFVTIIRKNWDLLSLRQISLLLEINEFELDNILKDYDFLSVKLGDKPQTEEPRYISAGINDREEEKRIKDFMEKNYLPPEIKPFDFYSGEYSRTELPVAQTISCRFVSSYSARYSGALADGELSDYPDEYLERLAATGINGIWLHDTLRNLADFPFDKNLSSEWQMRSSNLKKLTERCRLYGIGVYLYLNEPRSLPKEFFDKYPELKGQEVGDGEFCLCTSAAEIKQYLYEAVKSIAENVPLLKGVMTITMSENPTHCLCRTWNGLRPGKTDCPRCKNRKPEEAAAEINNIFYRALKDGNGYTKLIANLWGWSDFMGWDDASIMRGVDLLDKNIDVMCVSEYSKKFRRGGVKAQVIDYSISVIGPSDITVRTLKYAKSKGHRIWAKIQVNNSWECSGIPYLPVFDLMTEHIRRMHELGVSGLMMGWSLGGYPGGALPLCNCVCADKNYDETKWYSETYGENALTVRKAVQIFSKAFANFPLSINSLYYGGQTLAGGNSILENSKNRKSTMVCFTFGDYDNYAYPYGIKIYIELYDKLLKKWKAGLNILSRKNGNKNFEELKTMGLAAFVMFSCAENIAEIALSRNRNNSVKLKKCYKKQYELTKNLYLLICKDARIGFEMTNHYYYDENLLLERMYEANELAQNR